MTKKQSKNIIFIRQITQVLFLIIFFYLFISSGDILQETVESASIFFYFDPYLAIINFLASGEFLTIFIFSIITLLLTLLFGRFFCGWICPFGTINHFFSWLFGKSSKTKEELNPKLLNVKYLFLVFFLFSALLGTNFGGWLDPFSLLTRSTAALVSPANYLISQPVDLLISTREKLPDKYDPAANINKEIHSSEFERTSAQTILIPGIFLFFIIMNFYKRRFFCNSICPLGALLGLTSRFSLFRVKSAPVCNSCLKCDTNCSYNGNPSDDFIKSECNLCFNCSTDCPSEAVEYKFQIGNKKENKELDYGKRKLIGAAITGIILAALPKSSIEAKNKSRHSFMRPPGALGEEEFLDKCLRCGQCIESCPTSFIQPALAETGFGGLWTPVINAKAGYCIYECKNCTQVCPSEALETLSLKQKQNFKIGTAVIDKNRCYTYADGMNCTICEEACPTPQKAIQFRKVETWNFQGKLRSVNQLFVTPHLCIGCGICEYVCPRTDKPGIFMTSEDEIRERVTGNV